MRPRWAPISRLSSPWSLPDDWTNSKYFTRRADIAVRRADIAVPRRLFSSRRTLSRGADGSQVRAMPRQSDRRRSAHDIWGRFRADGVGGAAFGYGHGQLDGSGGAVSADRRL